MTKFDSLVVTEKDFEQQVHDLARRLGWKYYHTYRSKFSEPGFPDCVMVRGKRIIFAELKSENGKVSGAQQEWLEALSNVKPTYLWRPSDFDTEIMEVLR